MKKYRKWMKRHGRDVTKVSLAVVVSAGLLLFSLNSLIGGISDREAQTATASQSLSVIAHHPEYLPLKLVHWLFGFAPFTSTAWLRLPNVLFAGLTLLTTTFIIRRWYGKRMALFGFIIFASSAWFLHVGRLASFDILYLWAIPTLLASHLLLYDKPQSKRLFYLWLVAQLALLYIPGMIWFVIINALWQREELSEAWRNLGSTSRRLMWTGLALILLVPLAYGLITSTDIIHDTMQLIGLPASLPAPLDILRRAGEGLLFVGIRGNNTPVDLWLGRLPILDAFMSCMLLAGVYFYSMHWHATRTRLIVMYTLLGFILFALGGAVRLSIIVPVLYLLAAAGLAYLLHLWLTVFPRNPLARSFGILILSIAIAVSSIYSLRQYFIAWPHHTETQTAFKSQPIPRSHLIQ